jgi:glycosyltransferase involved in cell wall biosynthesis
MISIITPTHNNWGELKYCIDSVENQEFEDWQHVIVHDGPNPKLRERMYHMGYAAHGKRVFVELGRNWHGFMGGDDHPPLPGHPGTRGGRGSRGASVALFASYLASGKYITYLDADCTYAPDHLAGVNAVIQAADPDFVYTQMLRVLDGRPWDVIGDGQPRYGMIDCNAVTHKVELMKKANWRWGGDADWDLLAHFLENGANYAYIPRATVTWRHASDDV